MDPIKVTKGNEIYALLFKGKPDVTDGIRFFTQQTDEFQVGAMERPKGYSVKPHTHPRVDRTIHGLTEFLYLEKGSMKVAVFDEDWNKLAEETLNSGDFLIFFRGGHSVDMLEDSRIIEVKQGPYLGDANAKSYK